MQRRHSLYHRFAGGIFCWAATKVSHVQPDVSELDHMRRKRLILLSHLNVMKSTRSRSRDFEFARAERIDRVTTAVFDLDKRIAEIEVGKVLVRRSAPE